MNDRPNAESARSGWLISPLFDLLFIANVGWLLAFLPAYMSLDGTSRLEFWQIHFLITPHRWITLVLVVVDPDRRSGRVWQFIVIAVIAAAVILGVRLETGAFTCLGLIYLVWNGWHFASQHSGILRIYARKSGGGNRLREVWVLRTFVTYVTIRMASGADQIVSYLGTISISGESWYVIDVAMLILPVVLLVSELQNGDRRNRLAKIVYLSSVCLMYSSVLFALDTQNRRLVAALVIASAMFHSAEYFAIVVHYARRRQTQGSSGLFQKMARHWLKLLAWYLIVLGLFVSKMHQIGPIYFDIWFGINFWASILHFAYDGMIWKLRRPATAEALGVAATEKQ